MNWELNFFFSPPFCLRIDVEKLILLYLLTSEISFDWEDQNPEVEQEQYIQSFAQGYDEISWATTA